MLTIFKLRNKKFQIVAAVAAKSLAHATDAMKWSLDDVEVISTEKVKAKVISVTEDFDLKPRQELKPNSTFFMGGRF